MAKIDMDMYPWVMIEPLSSQQIIGLSILMKSRAQLVNEQRIELIGKGKAYFGWSSDHECYYVQAKVYDDDIVVSYDQVIEYFTRIKSKVNGDKLGTR